MDLFCILNKAIIIIIRRFKLTWNWSNYTKIMFKEDLVHIRFYSVHESDMK